MRRLTRTRPLIAALIFSLALVLPPVLILGPERGAHIVVYKVVGLVLVEAVALRALGFLFVAAWRAVRRQTAEQSSLQRLRRRLC
jgi:hypothetical protein